MLLVSLHMGQLQLLLENPFLVRKELLYRRLLLWLNISSLCLQTRYYLMQRKSQLQRRFLLRRYLQLWVILWRIRRDWILQNLFRTWNQRGRRPQLLLDLGVSDLLLPDKCRGSQPRSVGSWKLEWIHYVNLHLVNLHLVNFTFGQLIHFVNFDYGFKFGQLSYLKA